MEFRGRREEMFLLSQLMEFASVDFSNGAGNDET